MNKMKKTIYIILTTILFMCLVLSSQSSITSEAAVKKPTRVTNLQTKRLAKKTLKLSWKKVSGAKGYEVFMSTNDASFKKKTTITGNKGSCTIKLATGKKYAFRVRAYKLSGSKKIYGNFSTGVKINFKEYGYLVDMIEPYAAEGYSINNYAHSYSYYKGTYKMLMAGKEYHHSISFGKPNGLWEEGYIIYNFDNKYSKMTFTLGAVQGHEESDSSKLYVYADNELIKTYKRNKNDLPRTYTLNTKGVYKLQFFSEDNIMWGLGNAKLYYR